MHPKRKRPRYATDGRPKRDGVVVVVVVVIVIVVVVVVVVVAVVAVAVITILTKYLLLFLGAILCLLAFCPSACLPGLLARLPALPVCLLAPSLALFS